MRLADNHTGWEVQAYGNQGWFPVSLPLPTRNDAVRLMELVTESSHEYRVVESIKEK